MNEQLFMFETSLPSGPQTRSPEISPAKATRPQVVHQNSKATYHAERPKLSEIARRVVANVRQFGRGTDEQIAARMGFDHKSKVQPRITEAVDAGLLREVATVQNPATHKPNRVVDLA